MLNICSRSHIFEWFYFYDVLGVVSQRKEAGCSWTIFFEYNFAENRENELFFETNILVVMVLSLWSPLCVCVNLYLCFPLCVFLLKYSIENKWFGIHLWCSKCMQLNAHIIISNIILKFFQSLILWCNGFFFLKLCYHPTTKFMSEKCLLPCFWVRDCSFSLSANWIFLLIDSKPNGLFLLRLYCNLYLKMLAIVLKIEIVCCSDLE